MINELPTAFSWMHKDVTCTGMTLRDYFAAKAMQSFAGTSMWGEEEDIQIAKVAYSMADAMLKARGQT